MATMSTKPRGGAASMWWAPTNPGPTRPMPIRCIVFTRVRSCQRLPGKGDTLRHFLDRRPLPAVLVFDVGRDRPLLALQQLQHLANRRVALAPRHVVALVLLAVLQVQVGDLRMVLADIGDR